MEDFGFERDDSRDSFSGLTRKIALIMATILSVGCFLYITISAYDFFYKDKNSNIEIISAKKGPIKVIASNNEKSQEEVTIDRTIYEDIFGNNQEEKKQVHVNKVKNSPKPALPPKKKKEEKIAKPKPTPKPETKEISQPQTIKPKSNKRAVRVQVAAMTSKENAENAWQKLSNAYNNLFFGLKPYIQRVDLGKRGIFYRLQIGNFFNQVEAENFCEKYIRQSKKNSSDCIIVE